MLTDNRDRPALDRSEASLASTSPESVTQMDQPDSDVLMVSVSSHLGWLRLPLGTQTSCTNVALPLERSSEVKVHMYIWGKLCFNRWMQGVTKVVQ